MKKTFLAIAFMTVTFFANAFEGRLYSVDFDKKEFNQKGHKYELVELNEAKQAGERVVTFMCVDKESRSVSFILTFSEKGQFVKFKTSKLDEL